MAGRQEPMEDLRTHLEEYGLEGHGPARVNVGRNALALVFSEMGLSEGAEIGVERGLYSEVLLSMPNLKLHLIDPLEAYAGYREHVSQEKLDGFYDECRERLSGKNYVFHRKYSQDAVRDFGDGSLDFVYIDANHEFTHVTNDIAAWEKKVRVGGVIAGHDFNRNKKKDYVCHVKDVVQAWTYAHGITEWFVTSDKSPSWLWQKI